MASVPQPSISAARQELYRRMDKHNLAPLWEVLHSLIPDEPVTPCKPALWKYRDARPYLMEAGKLITAKEAIRRVLVLENPGHARRVVHHAEPVRRPAAHPAGRDRAQPPPLAVGAALHRRGRGRLHRGRRRAHHHAAGRLHHHAVVDLARPRQPAATSRWCGWTASISASCRPSRAQFHEVFPEEVQPVSRSEGASVARFGQGLVPLGAARAVRQDLADLQLSRTSAAASRWPSWRRTRSPTPATAGRWSSSIRSPAATPCRPSPRSSSCCPRASRRSPTAAPTAPCSRWSKAPARRVIGGQRFDFEPRDTFVVPSWVAAADREQRARAVLFSFSDRPGQEAMGLWREKRG